MLRAKGILALCVVAMLAFVAAGCGDEADTTASAPSATAATGSTEAAMKAAPKRKSGQKEIQTGKVSPYGKILQDGRGHTIYLFTKEESSKSECYDACAAAWPPVLTRNTPFAGEGVRQSKLGTTKRTDGKKQVTYNGHPLYYYVDEREPDLVLCQAVEEFGGLWYIMDKRGNAVT
ncbi:MAG: COG4315 family predicted lipoprotein [Solirubrobacterales bacterium]